MVTPVRPEAYGSYHAESAFDFIAVIKYKRCEVNIKPIVSSHQLWYKYNFLSIISYILFLA